MPDFFVGTIADADGPTAVVVTEDGVHLIPGRPSVADLFADWDSTLHRLEDDLRGGTLGEPQYSVAVRILPPVPQPPNLYMAGANYADHAREMRGLGPDEPIDKP